MNALPFACRVSPREEHAPRALPDVWYQAGAWQVTAAGLRGPDQLIPAAALGLKDREGLLAWPLRMAKADADLSAFLDAFGVALALHGFRTITDEVVRASTARAFGIRNTTTQEPVQPAPVAKVTAKPERPTGPAAPSPWVMLDGTMSNGLLTIAADRLHDLAVLGEAVAVEPMGLELFLALWPLSGSPDAAAAIKLARKQVRVWHYETFGRKLAA